MKNKSKSKYYSALLVFVFVFSIFSALYNFPIQYSMGAENWYDASYNYRQLITINSSQVPTTLTNFPALININADTNLSLHAQVDGDDIFFIKYTDNSTKYHHEIEHYNAGTLQAWVNVTSVSSSTDTLVWLYYGNSTIGSQENVPNTWDSDYAGVWHLDDNDLTDSTSNGYDATTSGTADSNNGAVAGCREFSYTNGENLSVDPWGGVGSEFTVECWINQGSSVEEYVYPRYAIQGNLWNSDSDWCFYGRTAVANMNFRMVYNATSGSATSGGVHPPAGDYWWYLVYGVDESKNPPWGRQDLRINKTGTGYHVDTRDHENNDDFPYLTFGNERPSASAKSFDGWMDEIRISTINRTTSWLDTTYNTIALSSDFQYISISEEALVAGNDAPIISAPSPSDSAVGQVTTPICEALITDPDADDTTVYFYENTTGNWVLQQTNTTHASGTIAQWDNYTNASDNYTKYWWTVNATDGTNWDNETFSFTTSDIPPILGTPSPANGSTGNALELSWSILMNDTDGDTISWTVECENGQTAEGSGQPPYNTPTLADTDMFVEKWDISTAELGHYISSEPVTADVNGDGIEEIFIGGRPYPTSSYPIETNQWSLMSCIDGATGSIIWQVNFTVDYVLENGTGTSGNQHWCPAIYDFNKTNDGLEITWSGGMKYHRMYDALTGNVGDNPPWIWNTSAFAGGWHNIGYMDDGIDVFLYTIEGINSIHAYAKDGDEGLTKSYANNGTMIKRARHGYECFGGAAIADINDDGIYEILVTDRGGTQTGVYKGLSCYDEDLNFLWAYQPTTFSTQVPIIADVDEDGDLEVMLGGQNSAGLLHIFSGNPSGSVGEIESYGNTSTPFGRFHHQGALGNTDDDSNLEFFCSGYTYNPTYVYDFIDGTMTEIDSLGATHGGEITNIVEDAGVQINELLVMYGSSGVLTVFQYNTTTGNYDDIYDFANGGIMTMTSDVDFDGYKELVIVFWNRLEVWETNVTVQDPKPLTNVAFGGMRRMNNDEFTHPPGYYEFVTYGEDNGTKTLNISGLGYNTEYTVWVNATDSGSGLYVREWFTFTTLGDTNLPPIIKNQNPSNNSIGELLSFTWQTDIEDSEGDTFNWSIECAGFSNSSNGDTNGTKTMGVSGLSYNTTYIVYVNATDLGSGSSTNNTFNFKTMGTNVPPVLSSPNPANNSFVNTSSVTWNITMSDADEDGLNWTIQCNNSQSSASEGANYFGAEATVQTGYQSFEDDIIGAPFVMPSGVNAYAVNISVEIGSSGQLFKVKCALYDENKIFIGATEERILSPASPTWQVFNLSDPTHILTGGATYYLVAFMNQSSTPSDYCSIRYDGATGENIDSWILYNYGYDACNGEFPEFDFNTTSAVWGTDQTIHIRCNYEGSLSGQKSLPLSGLTFGATYDIWVNVTDGTFWTNRTYDFTYAFVPIVTTDDATLITNTNATLNGHLNNYGGEDCSVWFELGTTTTYNGVVFDLFLLDELDTGGLHTGLVGDGTYLYVAAHTSGLKAYSFDGVDLTYEAGRDDYTMQNVWHDGAYVYGVAGLGGIYAYSFDGNTFTLLDVQDDGGSYRDAWSDGTYVYTACYDSGIRAYSFDGVSFTLLDTNDTEYMSYSVWGDGTYIYVADGSAGITAYSFNGVSFTFLSRQDDGSRVYGVHGNGSYIYTASYEAGVRAYSFNGTIFTLLDTQDDGVNYMDVWSNNAYIYIDCFGSGVYAYTFDGNSFTLMDSQDDGQIYNGVWSDGTYVYTTCGDDGIRAYSPNWQDTISSGDSFSFPLVALDKGQLYRYRAVVENSFLRVNGSDSAFLTKPDTATTFDITTDYAPTSLNLSWTKGVGANNTYIERKTTSTWVRGTGIFVYNDTGSYYNDTGLLQNTLYYYQLWSYTNWTYNPTLFQWGDGYTANSNTTTTIDPPYNGNSSYDVGTYTVNLTWMRGNNSDREIVIQNNNSFSTSPTDGWVRQNSTNTWFNGSINYGAYFTVWSYNDTIKTYSTVGLNIPWGALGTQCYDEITHDALVFDLLITNSDLDTYSATNLTNVHYVDMNSIPYGTDTIFYISNDTHESRTYYHDINLNSFYNLTFFLPLATPSGGTSDPDYDPENESYATLYLLTVVDEVNEGIEDVRMEIMRYINDTETYENVTILLTDANGQADVYLFSGTVYKVRLIKTGYVTRIDDYTPSDSIYVKTFKMKYDSVTPPTPDEPPTWTAERTGTMLYVNYTDSGNKTTDSQIYIYEINAVNGTLTLIANVSYATNNFTYSTTVNSSNDHEVILFYNHTTFGAMTDFRLVKRVVTTPTTQEDVDALFDAIYGTSPAGVGWSNIVMWIIMLGAFVSGGRESVGMWLVIIGFILLFINFWVGFNTMTAVVGGGVVPVLTVLLGLMVIWRDKDKGK